MEIQAACDVCLEWEESMRQRHRKSSPKVYEDHVIRSLIKIDYEGSDDIEAVASFDHNLCIKLCQTWMQERISVILREESEEDDENEDDKKGPLNLFERVVHGITQTLEAWTGSHGMTDMERAQLRRNFCEFCTRINNDKQNAQQSQDVAKGHRVQFDKQGEFLFRLLHTSTTVSPTRRPTAIKLSFYEYMKFCILSRAVQREALEHLSSYNCDDVMRSIIQIGLSVHSQVDQHYNQCLNQNIFQTPIPLFLGGQGTIFTDHLLGKAAFRDALHVRISDAEFTPESTGTDLGDYIESLISKVPFTRQLLEACKNVNMDIVAVYGEFATLESLNDPIFLRSIASHELPLWIYLLQHSKKALAVEFEHNEEAFQVTSEQFWNEAARSQNHLHMTVRTFTPERDEDELEDMASTLDSVPIKMEGNTVEARTERESLFGETRVVYAERINAESVIQACQTETMPPHHDDGDLRATGWRFMIKTRALFDTSGAIIHRTSS